MQEHYLKYFLPLLQVPRSYELTTRWFDGIIFGTFVVDIITDDRVSRAIGPSPLDRALAGAGTGRGAVGPVGGVLVFITGRVWGGWTRTDTRWAVDDRFLQCLNFLHFSFSKRAWTICSCYSWKWSKTFLKVSKFQKQLFFKLHCPKNERNIRKKSSLWI